MRHAAGTLVIALLCSSCGSSSDQGSPDAPIDAILDGFSASPETASHDGPSACLALGPDDAGQAASIGPAGAGSTTMTTVPGDAGQTPSDLGPTIADVVAECQADSGPCSATVECVGKAEDRICDASRFISGLAALCIARKAGMAEGLRGLSGELVYNYGWRRVVWNVGNLLRDESDPAQHMFHQEGQSFDVDAVTGVVLGRFQWAAMS